MSSGEVVVDAVKLRAARENAKWSQMDVANAFGIRQPTVSHWESGHRSPGLRVFELAGMFGVDVWGLVVVPEAVWDGPPERVPRAEVVV